MSTSRDPAHGPPDVRARRVGFVGLGAMGSPMSGHLLADGWTVVGHDLDPAARARHESSGGLLVEDLAAMASSVDVVVTSLPGTAALAGVLSALAAGVDGTHPLVVIETSTLALPDKLAAREAAAAQDIVLLDCPVSGTSAQAQVGDLIAYLSGAEGRAGDLARPVLTSMTRATHDVGEFGNGTRMKLVANLLVAVHNLAAAEALLLAQRSGLDLSLVLGAVGDGAGSSRMLQVRGPLMVDGTYDEATARVEMFQKDLRAIQALAVAVSSPTPLLAATAVFYDAAMAQGRSDQDTACVFDVLQQLTSPRSSQRGLAPRPKDRS